MTPEDANLLRLQDELDTMDRERDAIRQRRRERQQSQSADNDLLLSLRDRLISLIASDAGGGAAVLKKPPLCNLPVGVADRIRGLLESGQAVQAADLIVTSITQSLGE
jgi:hypothetical protein